MTRFHGRTVLITGGARGQGLSHALAFARRMTGMGIPWIDIADVTHAVLFLADEGSRYISGEVLHVSAGGIAFNTA